MDNTHKLLLALIDAFGFDVKRVTGKAKIDDGDFVEIIDYIVINRVSGGIKCTKCGTHLAKAAPLDSCLCKKPDNLVRVL